MKSNKFGWKFEESQSGKVKGLNEGGVEHFEDNPLYSLAKESAQNSSDARLNFTKPVILEFNTFYIENKDFPDLDRYKEIIDLEIEFWKATSNDRSAVNFFKKAKEIINSKKIFCLRISDFNTIGLEGSREGRAKPFSNWFKLVMSTGSSDNDSTKGGSFGIGKFSTFACSDLRTVIYNTQDEFGVESHQGVSILASHDTKKGKRTVGEGYYCNLQDFSRVPGQINLDKNFIRKERGTDIYIIGLAGDESTLKREIFPSILRSFLPQIYKGSLVFRFNGEDLDKDNLGQLIEEYRESTFHVLEGHGDIIEDYDILNENLEVKTYSLNLLEEDDVYLKIALKPYLSKRIAMYRGNGMKIFDKKGLRLSSDFVGGLFLKGDKVNKYFRDLENPNHDGWSHHRDPNNNPKKALDIINKLYSLIKESLKDLENKIIPELDNIEGIDSLLDEDFEEEEGVKPIEGLEFKPLKIKPTQNKKIRRKKIKILTGLGGRKPSIKNSGSGNKPGGGGPGEEDEKKISIRVLPEKIKIFQSVNEEYTLIFNLQDKSESVKCKIFIGGEESNEAVKIDKAKIQNKGKNLPLKVKNNEIELGEIEGKKRHRIKFKLKEKGKWALEAEFYDN